MSNRWQANRIGLVNFWYYDEQEFPFAKGRMLLRGSNGSGKSVTMQSVVPLLLDGNVNPERLDPFGTRDRKMSNYLLEEDDGREERTGYLYLEFRKKENGRYLTIGMGLRARRGKSLDKWYFSLSDGRRIGEDFFLYKETGEKITLSKKELENRIANGGRVFERQADYMAYVNQEIFGFETVDEYKEMIDLLIQLRTPKLSKDFKPSVINEILSDSLQPLSDEDLRPMSEAIENMDTMNLNLKSRQMAYQAAEKIQQVFQKYNALVLYEKANAYQEKIKEYDKLQIETSHQGKLLEECKAKVETLKKELEEIEAERISREKEKETLNQSDAWNLKKRESELKQSIYESETTIVEKQDFLETKKDQQLEIEARKKEQESRCFEEEKEVNELLEEMQSEAEDMAFEEHTFFQQEFIQNMDRDSSYDTHEKQFRDTHEKIRETLEILKETRYLERQVDEMMQQREQIRKGLDQEERRQAEMGTQFVQVQSDWKDQVYRWNMSNKELVLDATKMEYFSRFIDSYEMNSDFTQVRQQINETKMQIQWKLDSKWHETEKELQEKMKEYQEVQEEWEAWNHQKEPEPPRSEAVIKNRKRLDKLGIPYHEFYKVIEFGNGMDEKSCNHLEEALLNMGILDALIVEEQYRDQVLTQAAGCEERYLFVQQYQPERSLLDVLELNDEVNNIFSNQRLIGILSNIAYEDSGVVSIRQDGSYQLGIINGTITGEYEAGLLGSRARERNRLAKIAECEKRREEISGEISKLHMEKEQLEERKAVLQQEYDSLPEEKETRRICLELEKIEQKITQIEQEKTQVETKISMLRERLRKKKERAYEIARKLYLDCTYAVFERAASAAERYDKLLMQLLSAHKMYLRSSQTIRALEEQFDNLETDMERIRYDISIAERTLGKCRKELESICEQLKLTDYEEIKERLDACVKWLEDYPKRSQECVRKLAENEGRIEQLREQLENSQDKIARCEKKRDYLKKVYLAEKNLNYVPLEEDIPLGEMCKIIETEIGGLNRNEVNQKLNQVYYENRGALNEYQLILTKLFEEIDLENVEDRMNAQRIDIQARYQGTQISFVQLPQYLKEDIAELEDLIKAGDRELFEDILANTVSRKIRGKINASNAWVEKMNHLMNGMNTSSGLKLSLRWRSKTAESEEQLDTRDLVQLLKKDYRLMSVEEASRLSTHFRSKVDEARRNTKDNDGEVSFYQVMKETLDYRKWFEFQLFSQKTGERLKELTNNVFGTFSGGEKAMSMYVPLFSAVVAKYQGGREDAPRLISLDEAFAGVDNRNIRDMFRLMTEFEFDFIINSQVLWGDCDTLDALAIYQLQRPQNAKFVTVMPYLWNGHAKEFLENERMVEQRSEEIG
ncbi:MAG: TIGR02680 family protein [Clostridiales bacterium]|nr:TIGR02680 family protein [Clostridiales bacterium]